MSKYVYIVTDSFDAGDCWDPMGDYITQLVGVYSSKEEAHKRAVEYYKEHYSTIDNRFITDDEVLSQVKIVKTKLDKTYYSGKVIDSFSYYDAGIDETWDD